MSKETTMKKIFNIPVAGGMMALVLGGMTSCDKDKLLTTDYPEAYPTTDITFVVSEELYLGLGMDSTLVYRVGPDIATDKTISFNSSNVEVCTVDSEGKITATGVGEATVSAVPLIGFGANASVLVKVIPEVVKATEVKVTNLTEPSEEGFYYETDEVQLACEILPEDHTYDYVTWTSQTPEVASVDENGLVRCLKEGDAHIRCHTHDHSKVAGDYRFHVYKMQEVERLEIKPLEGALCITQGNVRLDVTYYPEGATIGSVEWTSSDPTVVDVKRGVITPKGWGRATVTAMAPSGESASIDVTVEQGWYVWDSNWGWGNWSCDNVSYTDFGLHAQFNDSKGGKWRNDLKYLGISPTVTLPFDWSTYKVMAARFFHLPSGGNANMDAVDQLSGINSNNLRPSRTELSDGSCLYIWDASGKYNNAYTEMRIYNLKVADIPNDRYSSVDEAYYDVKWIRTFKTADDALQFANDEISKGE